MDRIKIDNFRKAHPDEEFPAHRSLSESERREKRNLLAHRLGVGINSSGLHLLRQLHLSPRFSLGTALDKSELDLRELVREAGKDCGQRIFLNWGRFDEIDEMEPGDFSRHFGDIWYPSSDDLEILDESMDWALAISHDGMLDLILLAESSVRGTV